MYFALLFFINMRRETEICRERNWWKRPTLSDMRSQHAAEEQQDLQYVSSHGNSRSSSIDSVDRYICKKKKEINDGERKGWWEIQVCVIERFLIFPRTVGMKFLRRYLIIFAEITFSTFLHPISAFSELL